MRETSSQASSNISSGTSYGQSSFKLIRGGSTGIGSSGQSTSKIWKMIFDLPGEKVNKFGKRAIADFEAIIQELEAAQSEIDALIVVSGKPGNFIAGADIEMLKKVQSAEEGETLSRTGQKLIDRFEDCTFPKIAVIDGAAMGAGCEFALACDAVVMSNSSAAKIGLPEVLLGLCPGMGGCVRLPQKVGIATALDLILTGKTLSGEKAFKAGLAEACLPKEDIESSAQAWVIANLKKLKTHQRLAREPKLGGMGGVAGMALESFLGRGIVYSQARSGVLSKTKGHYPAPLEAIKILQDNGASYGPKLRGSERESAMGREARGFGKLSVTPECKNLIALFFMTELVKKSKGVSSVQGPGQESGDGFKLQPISDAGVLGAGVMGGGIAQLFADKGIRTRMKDISTKSLSIGMQSAGKIFEKQVKRKKITKRQFTQKMNLIAPSLDYSGFLATEIVVEAVVEKMELKQSVLRELETKVKNNCVIVTNTSSLAVSQMQSVLKNPERFAGMHFFNPVSRMPLVEVIRGDKTSDQTVACVYQFTKQLGKTPIVVKDSPGFLVNRLLAPYLNEGVYLLQEGVSIEELDQAILDFGMPMGPAELIDEVGVDVADKVAHILNAAFGDRLVPASLNSKLLSAGRLGKKSGQGFYIYTAQKKAFDPSVYGVLGINPSSSSHGLSKADLVERCLLPMINEAARCLEEGVVAQAWEVDLGLIMGTGFPPFRGGLLKYADDLGLNNVIERLRFHESEIESRQGKSQSIRYTPSVALVKMAEQKLRFYH